jgi:hypothetical protein
LRPYDRKSRASWSLTVDFRPKMALEEEPVDFSCLFQTCKSGPLAAVRQRFIAGSRKPSCSARQNHGNFAAFYPQYTLMPVAPARLQLNQEQP